MAAPLVSLLTDFGLADPSVAAVKGTILRIAPEVRLLDVSHDVARQSIAGGAAVLWAALPYLPVGTHLAVVDPGVGTARRPIGIKTWRGDLLVGPDNGLLVPAAERLGGIVACRILENPRYRLAHVSRTFHGRDVFAPAAAHLALGVPLDAFGPAVPLDSLVRLDLPAPAAAEGSLDAAIAFVDHYGNAQLLAGHADLERALGPIAPGAALNVLVAEGPQASATWQLTYGDAAPGELLVCVDSYDRLALAVNGGSAADALGLGTAARLTIRRA